MSQPRIWPLSGETMCTSAPWPLRRSRGTSSSDCSKPWVASMATLLPFICMGHLLRSALPSQQRPTRLVPPWKETGEETGERPAASAAGVRRSSPALAAALCCLAVDLVEGDVVELRVGLLLLL